MDTKAFVENTVSRSLDKYLELHPDGSSVPAGGATGDALTKASDNDGDVQWSTVMTEEVLNNRTLTPTGWGVAKTGVVRLNLPSNDGVAVSVDLTDLNLASVDDYNVSVTQCNGDAAWGRSLVYCKKVSTTQLSVGAYKNESGASYVDVAYVVVAKGYGGTHFVDGTGLPVGGEDGQILTKIGNEDGVVDWGFDTGADLVKYGREYGIIPTQVAITRKAAIVEKAGTSYSTTKFSITTGGVITNVASFKDGILNTFDMYVTIAGYSESRVTSYNSTENGYGLSNTDLRFYLSDMSLSGDKVLFSAFASLPFDQRIVNAVRVVARGNNNFGIGDGTKPYDIRNLTGMVLDDLKVTGTAVPTDWGIAHSGKLNMTRVESGVVGATLDVSGFNFASADDYTISIIVRVGADGAWGDSRFFYTSKTATAARIQAYTGSNTTSITAEYTIFAKGYGNNTMSAPNAILESPNGTRYKLKVADDGTLSTEAV